MDWKDFCQYIFKKPSLNDFYPINTISSKCFILNMVIRSYLKKNLYNHSAHSQSDNKKLQTNYKQKKYYKE